PRAASPARRRFRAASRARSPGRAGEVELGEPSSPAPGRRACGAGIPLDRASGPPLPRRPKTFRLGDDVNRDPAAPGARAQGQTRAGRPGRVAAGGLSLLGLAVGMLAESQSFGWSDLRGW